MTSSTEKITDLRRDQIASYENSEQIFLRMNKKCKKNSFPKQMLKQATNFFIPKKSSPTN
jgi:hypothetical protein